MSSRPELVWPGLVAVRAASYAAEVKCCWRKIALVASIDPIATSTRIGRQTAELHGRYAAARPLPAGPPSAAESGNDL